MLDEIFLAVAELAAAADHSVAKCAPPMTVVHGDTLSAETDENDPLLADRRKYHPLGLARTLAVKIAIPLASSL
ncbi:hypothetical protein GCM10010472_11010 [Pseudonocardia halophobica]|uniref:Uncharacterized protein n=1 Tax=Pseudonocardia halophobica TaxID=29401 RepID=A0A9W6L5L1_9PSEU|nr:hypothetical protein GCM10017577_46320 [Pseudonocardia halophobica]